MPPSVGSGGPGASIKPRASRPTAVTPRYLLFFSLQFPVSDHHHQRSGGQAGMVSREPSYDYEHLVLDHPAVELPPQLLAALGEYYLSSSARGGGGEDEADNAEADDEFMMYEFKVRRCARARSHDWTACPYAHPGEAARRRDPRRAAYAGDPCPDFRRRPGAACPRGAACPLAHGTFELWLHPSRYRTRPCRAGPACRRRVCFFAHTAAELRDKQQGDAALCSPLSLCSPRSTLAASLCWESPPVSPVEAGRRWIDEAPDAADDAEVEELMQAMRELSFRKAPGPVVLPAVTEEDGPDLGWVSELVM